MGRGHWLIVVLALWAGAAHASGACDEGRSATGFSLVLRAGVLAVGAVDPGSPAERAGLRPGDRIRAIDGDSIDGVPLTDVLQRLRGEVGTSVGVSVQRPKTGETVDVTIERAAILR